MATMKKPKYPNGLRAAMERAGKGPTELADRLETNKQNITRWSNGDRKLTVEWAKKLAPLLDTTPDVLLLVSGREIIQDRPTKGQKRVISVPLLDTITAGKLKAPSSQIPVEDVPLLAFADLGRGDWFALKLEQDADSMDRLSPPGSVLVVNKADRELRHGRCYIFSVEGETTYKMWQDGDPAYMAPFSTNPLHKPVFIRRKRDFDVIGRVKRTVLDL